MKLFYRCTSERKAQSVEMDQESGVGSSSASGGGSSSEEQDNGGSCEDTSSSSFYTSSESGPDIAGDDDLDNLLCQSEGYSTDTSQPSSRGEPATTLHWVRMSSLRVHDNASLNEAMLNSKTRFRAVFIIDPWFASGERKFGVNRWRFLLECLHDLDKRLKSYGSRLYVAKGHPVALMERLCTRWNVTELTFQLDREVRSHVLEEAVEKLAEQMNIKVMKRQGHTLYDTAKLLEKAGNNQIATIKDFKEILSLAGKPDLPVEAPPVPITTYEEQLPEEFSIPTLQDLGFSGSESLYCNIGGWIGGETMALKRLVEYCSLRSKPQSDSFVDKLFDKSSLSPYIRFGCLSVRYFLNEVKKLASKDSSMETLLKDVTGKLLQREFYFTVAKQVPNFDCYDNHISFQLPWEEDSHLFALWKNGKTGYPWIDAAMRQLRREGWTHLCLRESVASFLTRGDLWISWVWGKDTFEELMLDYEVNVSSGCWMKSSCSAFITGPVEHFCPVSYGKQIDPSGIYVRTYCPELKHYPDEYIYCPWMAPLEVQKAAGCLIGMDYPNPIIDHSTAGFLCCEKLRSLMDMVHQGPAKARHTLKMSNRQRANLGAWSGVLQTHLRRYHPYSQVSHSENLRVLDIAAADSLLNRPGQTEAADVVSNRTSMASDSNDKSRENQCTSSDGSGSVVSVSQPATTNCCMTCVSTDNLMTQVFCEYHRQEGIREENSHGKIISSTTPPHRGRRKSPPSNCSHKNAGFVIIT